MKIRGFKVRTEKFENNIIETEYECDLIDHDTTGDIRLYNYEEKGKYRLCIEKLKLFSTYKKSPPEVVKDDFAYDRLLLFFQEESQKTLKELGEL